MTYAEFIKQHDITHAQAAKLFGYESGKSIAVSKAFARDFPAMLDEWTMGVLHKRPNVTSKSGYTRDYQRIDLALTKIILHKQAYDVIFDDATTPGEILRINDFLSKIKTGENAL